MLRETLEAIDIVVSMEDRKFRPALKPGDLVRFEQHFGRSLVNATGETTFGVTDMMFLAWSGMKREGDTELDFDAFCDQVDDIDLGEPGKDDPSGGSPSPG